jgi:hypothetical protein
MRQILFEQTVGFVRGNGVILLITAEQKRTSDTRILEETLRASTLRAEAAALSRSVDLPHSVFPIFELIAILQWKIESEMMFEGRPMKIASKILLSSRTLPGQS